MKIAITPGDPDGIGPEVTKKALARIQKKYKNQVSFLIIGNKEKLKGLSKNHSILAAPNTSSYFVPGFQAGWSIEVAAKLCLSGECAAMVTGPISKERLQKGGYHFNGHTDMLAAITQTKKVTMMLLNQHLRVALVTTHLALSAVSMSMSKEAISETIKQVYDGLKNLFGVKKPRIAILALNPHAGEAGLFGNEEIHIIVPAIDQKHSFGPFPADTFFALEMNKPKTKRFDAVVGMYHDQVLIPVKMLDFSKTVNLTLGLPIIRTSVDHGTAFDIAGKNRANPDSMVAAIELAIDLARRKRKEKT
ncbi:MAG: 4-hydroxythreonine-4-phosphate dehydrogenase PdxA [Xanthomonadaceae bacterium]|nr:4-hydroxythreonine-4-phosphate dehydrogenase PdxA [Xanthomonadaceae bacterium]